MKKIDYETAQAIRRQYPGIVHLNKGSRVQALQEIGRIYGLSERHLRNIIAGKVWRERVWMRWPPRNVE